MLLAGLMLLPAAASQAQEKEKPQPPQYPQYPSETPAKFEVHTASFDFVKRDEMIPMRDGVKLHSVILVPKGAKDAPILLTRTPYEADHYAAMAQSPRMGRVLDGGDNVTEIIVQSGYIRVLQDVRGKYG